MSISYNIASPIDLRLPETPEIPDNPQLYQEIAKIYNALRNLQVGITDLTGALAADPSVWDKLTAANTIKTQNLNRFYCKATEAISFGNVINLLNDGSGNTVMRKAYANSGDIRPCHGILNTAGGVAADSYAEVILASGLSAGVGGMTIGTTYYLSTSTPGVIQAAKPVSPNLIQPVGFAITPTLLYFFSPPV